jgi:PIN domain nuclease of toxin-antitoxin system
VIVIDTHVLVWWTNGAHRQLTTASREAIVRADVVAFSSVSAWEIGTLARRGRIDIDFGTADWLREVKDSFSLEVLPVTLEIAIRAAELQETLRDPIDCLIAASALANNAALITKDDRIRTSGS